MGNGNQRLHVRRAFEGDVRVDGQAAAGVDISMGGVRVANIEPAPEVGRIVLVEFVLPGCGAIATRAEVTRVDDGTYSLRFVRLDPSSLMKLAQYSNREAA